MSLQILKLKENAVIPKRGSDQAAGYDLSSIENVIVKARSKAMIDTGIAIGIPAGCYARVAPRSGLTWKHSIDVGAGVIDADYRDSIRVILFNHSNNDFEVKVGDRIAQLILEKILTPEIEVVSELNETRRGKGGFGSTG
jgi:dUTP pyrophosphatase